MSWLTVLSQLRFPTVSSGNVNYAELVGSEKDSVIQYLELLYIQSATARSVLESVTSNGVVNMLHTIQEPALAGTVFASGAQLIGLNLDLISRLHYVNSNGRVVAETGSFAAISIIHEFIHLLSNTSGQPNADPKFSDVVMNGVSFDHKGDVLPIQNQIAIEMGWPAYQQASYLGGFVANHLGETRSELMLGAELTEGNHIDVARFGDDFIVQSNKNVQITSNIIDHSSRTSNLDDLIISFSDADAINAGDGRDYIYAGDGDDTIIGGKGDDLIHGGMLGGDALTDGLDTVDYSQNSSAQGIAIVIDGAATQYDSLSTIKVQDGQGGVDRLVSIERVTATGNADTFKFSGKFAIDDLKLKIDAKGSAGGQKDVIDLAASTAGFAIRGSGDHIAMVQGQDGGAEVEIANYWGDLTGSAHSDLIVWDFPEAVRIEGGDGADFLVGGNHADTEVLGGAGSDFVSGYTVDGGAGNDVNAGAIIKFSAGGGHDVILGDDGSGAVSIVDIGDISLTSCSLVWERIPGVTVDYTFEYAGGDPRGYEDFQSTDYTGRIALRLPSGDTIAIGSATAIFDTLDLRLGQDHGVADQDGWVGVHYALDVVIRSGGSDTGGNDILIALGLEQSPEPGRYSWKIDAEAVAPADYFSAMDQFEAAYSGQSPMINGGTATTGNDIFIGNNFGKSVTYSGSTGPVTINLGLRVAQNTTSSGLDLLRGITDLYGSAFGDTLIAGDTEVDYSLNGEDGDDTLIGGASVDSLSGGAGDDQLYGGAGDNSIYGGDGYDTAVFSAASTHFAWERQNDGSVVAVNLLTNQRDTLFDVEAAWFEEDSTWHAIADLVGEWGSENDDWLGGNSADNQLFGNGGDDIIYGAGGDDYLNGGAGFDQANYVGDLAEYVYSRNEDGSVTLTDTLGRDGVDTLVDIDALYFDGDGNWRTVEALVGDYGTSGDDAWIDGTSGNDRLYGLEGDDTLFGRAGDDQLFGGDGFDQANYFGASSNFTFIFNPDGTITVTDLSGNEGVDLLADVEALYFEADQTWIAMADQAQSVANGSTGFATQHVRSVSTINDYSGYDAAKMELFNQHFGGAHLNSDYHFA